MQAGCFALICPCSEVYRGQLLFYLHALRVQAPMLDGCDEFHDCLLLEEVEGGRTRTHTTS